MYFGGYMVEYVPDKTVAPSPYVYTDGTGEIRRRIRSNTTYTSPTEDNTNYVDLSEDMANWAQKSTTNTPTNKYLTINGKRIPIDNCDDTSAAGYYNSQVYNYIPINPGDECHFSLFCLKDAIPATTRHPMIRAQFSNGSSRGYDINWTTDGGVAATANVTFTNWGVEEKTDDNGTVYYHVWGSIADDVANNNTAFTIQFYPAVGNSATLTNYSVTGVGSCDVGGWIMNPGAITEAPEYFGPTTGPRTDGTPEYFYDNGVTPNVVYLYKGAEQPLKDFGALALGFNMDLVTDLVYDLVQDLVRD
jgi:hypothetical protein